MGDSIVLYAPGGGTSIQIGSWLDIANGGADYGAKGLIDAQFVDNPYSEGALAFEQVGPRRMSFPLLVNPRAVASLTQLETVLRNFARPGGYIDVQPQGIPSAEAVRFDILSGRWEPAYNTYLGRVDRRRGSLLLDTGPYGYWPTWITLASAASVGLPGRLTGFGGSVIGDAPALVSLIVAPTSPTHIASGAFIVDTVAWSLSGAASFLGALQAGSWGASFYSSDSHGFATVAQCRFAPAASGWVKAFTYTIPSALEPAYRGRFRAFITGGPDTQPMTVSLDSVPGTASWQPALASAAAIATSFNDVYYHVDDLGEITLPIVASGIQQAQQLRLWVNSPSNAATTTMYLARLLLLPVAANAGIVARGLAQPTVGVSPSQMTPAGFKIDNNGPVALNASAPIADLRRYHLGPAPYATPSSLALDLLAWQRIPSVASTNYLSVVDSALTFAAASIQYQPRFQFLKGI